MQPSVSITPIREDSIVTNDLSSKKPTTLLLRTNRPYLYNSWRINNRLRLKNEKLTKRQQSSCRIAFYSFWLCVSAGIMIIIIYRFTDECSLTTDEKQFSIECLRHWLFLAAVCTSFLACTGVIFGACRYFRSQTLHLLYDDQGQTHITRNNVLLPVTISIVPPRQTSSHDDEHSNATIVSSLTNTSLRRKIPPFNYDELPAESNHLINSKSININNTKTRLFSSSTSTLSSPQSMFSTTRSSNASNTIIDSSKTKTTSTIEDTCTNTHLSYPTSVSGIDIWKKQQRLPSFH